jgi:hypothetical protein
MPENDPSEKIAKSSLIWILVLALGVLSLRSSCCRDVRSETIAPNYQLENISNTSDNTKMPDYSVQENRAYDSCSGEYSLNNR